MYLFEDLLTMMHASPYVESILFVYEILHILKTTQVEYIQCIFGQFFNTQFDYIS